MTDADRIIQLAKDYQTLAEQADRYRRMFLQTMLVIAASLPTKEFRISRWDYQNSVGHSLTIHRDPDTGDEVYTAVDERARVNGAQVC